MSRGNRAAVGRWLSDRAWSSGGIVCQSQAHLFAQPDLVASISAYWCIYARLPPFLALLLLVCIPSAVGLLSFLCDTQFSFLHRPKASKSFVQSLDTSFVSDFLLFTVTLAQQNEVRLPSRLHYEDLRRTPGGCGWHRPGVCHSARTSTE